MARLRIKTYKNNNSKNNAYGKTYGRLVYVDTLDTSDLCRHMMKHGTIYTPDVVKGVVERFVMCFEELLLEGNKIKLDGLGTFYLSANTEGVILSFRLLQELLGGASEELFEVTVEGGR